MGNTERQRFLLDKELKSLMIDEEKGNRFYRSDRSIGDYQGFLDISIVDIANRSLSERGFFRWYDMGCGQFIAGNDTMRSLQSSLDTNLEVRGIDINTESEEDFVMDSGAIISRGNIVIYPIPENNVDLITCVEGLYLIDKHMGFNSVLQALENWYSGLRVGGLLAVQNEAILNGYGVPLHVLDYLIKWSEKTKNSVVYGEGGETGRIYNYHRYIKITKEINSELHFSAISENDLPIIEVKPNDALDHWWSKFD